MFFLSHDTLADGITRIHTYTHVGIHTYTHTYNASAHARTQACTRTYCDYNEAQLLNK